MELWLQNCIFAYIYSCGDLDLWPWDFKFSEMLKPTPISLFNWQKFLHDTFKWSYGSKTAFLPIFGHVVTLTFDLWTSNFQNCLTLAQWVFLIDKSSYLVHLHGVMAPKLHFCPYLVIWWPWHWPLDLKFSEMLNTTRRSLFSLTKVPSWFI